MLLDLNILDLIARVAYIINSKVYYSIVVEIAFVILGVNWGAQLGYKHNSHINYVTVRPEKFSNNLARPHLNTKIPPNSTIYKMPPQRRALQEISGNNSHKRHLISEERAQIIALSEAGSKATDLATQFNVASTTIYYTLHKWATHATTKDLPRSGRPL